MELEMLLIAIVAGLILSVYSEKKFERRLSKIDKTRDLLAQVNRKLDDPQVKAVRLKKV